MKQFLAGLLLVAVNAVDTELFVTLNRGSVNGFGIPTGLFENTVAPLPGCSDCGPSGAQSIGQLGRRGRGDKLQRDPIMEFGSFRRGSTFGQNHRGNQSKRGRGRPQI